MRKISKIFISLALVAAMVLPFAACKPSPDESGGTIVVASGEFSGKFNPFFAKTAYDRDISDMTQAALYGVDRTGELYLNGIDGTKSMFEGTEYTYYSLGKIVEAKDGDKRIYTITIRDNVKFEDGHAVDIDDIIFAMYVYSDPTYMGSSTFYTLPIEGMQEYYSGDLDFSAASLDAYFEANVDEYEDEYQAIVKELLEEEYAWCAANYAAYGANSPGHLFSAFYGADDWDDEAAPEGDSAERAYYLDLAFDTYWEDPSAFDASYGGSYLVAGIRGVSRTLMIRNADAGSTAPNISGIVRLSDYSVKVTLTREDASALTKLGIEANPMHYYGNASKYDYVNNKFGFDKGNLDSIKQNNKPMGAGPYKFESYTSGVVTLVANEHYYKGVPSVKYLQFKEMQEADIISGVANGTIDAGNPSYSVTTVAEIKGHNTNNQVVGNKLAVKETLNLGYGYVGISAQNVKVGTDPGSEESKNLRKGYATMFAAYRKLSYDTYYADAATVIEYPMSNTSWAAPLPTDEGYRIAYSLDVDGEPIYTDDMTPEQRLEAALDAAIGFFKAAGFTYNESTGKFTDIPTYTAVVPGGGTGDHPNFAVVSNAAEALDAIGAKLIVDDRSGTATLWTDLDAGTVGMWTAAWQASVDPDMHQVYHSSNIVGAGGTDSNHYGLQDEALDDLIMQARASSDRTVRKNIYKEAMEIVLDWGVEIPAYQRLNVFLFSAERINLDTITVVSPFYSWLNEIENVKVK